MSAILTTIDSTPFLQSRSDTRCLSWIERAVLGVGIWEIPLQLDKYFMYHANDAEQGAVGGVNISITTISIAILFLLWCFETAINRRRIHSPVIFGFPMLIYISFVALSSLSATLPMLSMFDIIVLLQAYALYFYLANRITDRRDVEFCLYVLVAMLLTQSGLVMALASLGSRAHGRDYQFGPLWLSVWPDGRIAGSLFSAVVCGSVLAFMWMPAMTLTMSAKSRLTWVVTMIACAVGMLAVLMTQTRGAILTMMVGTVIIGTAMLWRGWLPRWTMFAAFLLLLIGAFPLMKVIQGRVLGDDQGSAESRKHLSLIGLQMIADQPIFGCGAGNCHLASQRYADQGQFRAEWFYTIHSKYLLTWVETGLFGFLSFLFVLGNGLRHGARIWNSRDRFFAPIGLAMVAGIAGHMLHMTVDIFNSRTQVQLLWAILGITAACYRVTCLDSSNESSYGGTADVA